MSEFNFDKLRNLNIPDEWADKTIQKVNNKRKIVFKNEFKITKLAIVVSVVLVFIFSVFTFCFPESNEDSIYSEQTEKSICSNILNSQFIMIQQSTTEDTSIESIITQETENKTDVSNDNYDVEPDEEQSNINTIIPSETTSSNGDYSANTSPATQETQYDEWLYSYHFFNIFRLSYLEEDRKVYCKIYSEDEEKFLGDPDLFSDEHLCEYEFINDTYCYYRYYPIHLGILIKNGPYTAYFYNSDGEIFFDNSFFFSRFEED